MIFLLRVRELFTPCSAFAKQVIKYLGVMIDAKLNLNGHLH